MTQAACGPCLTLEALDKLRVAHELRRDQFQRHVAFCAEMRGQIHRAHSALPQQAFQTVLLVEYLTDVTFQAVHLYLIVPGARTSCPPSAKREIVPPIRSALSLLRKPCGQDVRAPLSNLIPTDIIPIALAKLLI